MKILFCTHNDVDYGLDSLYDGLCRVLGVKNIFEYPTKATLHGSVRDRYSHFPLYFDYPVITNNDTKIKLLKDNKYDLIFVSTRVPRDSIFELIEKKSKDIPTIVLDMDDFDDIKEDLIDRLNARLYFKREYYKDRIYDNRIQPLSFSYSPKYIPSANIDKSVFLFWAGRGYSKRYKFIRLADEITKDLPTIIDVTKFMNVIYSQKEYSDKLLKSKIALNFKGYGWDNVRYYEVPLHRTLLFSKRHPLLIENDFTDGVNAVFFDSKEEMKEKLLYLINNKNYIDKIRLQGYEHCMEYHTTAKRAEQVLNKIRKAVSG